MNWPFLYSWTWESIKELTKHWAIPMNVHKLILFTKSVLWHYVICWLIFEIECCHTCKCESMLQLMYSLLFTDTVIAYCQKRIIIYACCEPNYVLYHTGKILDHTRCQFWPSRQWACHQTLSTKKFRRFWWL